MRGMNNLHISCEKKTISVSISHVRKRHYMYLITGMNNLHMSCEEKTISVSHERNNHPPYLT